jgi:hypothetical protein
VDDGSVLSASELFHSNADPRTVAQFFPLGLEDTFALGSLDFLRAIAAARDPEASGQEGLYDLAAAYAICESASVGRPVSVNDVLDGRVAAYQAEIDRHHGLS